MSQLIQHRLERATPESQGVDSASILKFIDAVEAKINEFHSFILVRHGRVVAEGWWSPYSKDYLHSLFSLSKSFTSTAVGLAASEGYFSLDDLLVSHFAEDLPSSISDNLAKMTIRHVLSMGTGHDSDIMNYMMPREDGNWAKGFLSAPVQHAPGTHFAYNTGATYMLSALVQKTTGLNLLDFLEPRLFRPLGIENPTWEMCPRGICVGGFGLSVRTEDIAAFGQLYLQKGIWADTRILAEAWVNEASSFQISNGEAAESDWTQGYGYQFWRSRHNAYRGDGAFGQYCIIMPEQDAVLAILGGTADMQAPLNIVWDILLPAMQEHPLPANASAQEKLSQRLASLSLPPVEGKADSTISAKLSGKRYQFERNDLGFESLFVDISEAGCSLKLKTSGAEENIACGYGLWQAGKSCLFDYPAFKTPMPIVASGAWLNDSTFKVMLRAYETPFYLSWILSFADEQLSFETTINVSFAPIKTLTLTALRH